MKVLFFDTWLKGIANFERLVPALNKAGVVDIKMLHIASWREPQKSIVNIHNGFKSYDISYYKTNNLYKILKTENPDVLVILNLYYLLDKALVVFCRLLGIKVVYLSHGAFIQNDDCKDFSDRIKNDLKKNFFNKIRKDTVYTLSNYFFSTYKTRKIGRFFYSFYKLLKDPFSMTIMSTYTDELAANRIIVYYYSDKSILINKRKFPDRDIYVVGNPELDLFYNTPIKERSSLMKELGIDNVEYLLYLDDGFVQSRLLSKDEWYEFLDEINKVCKKNNLSLIIKLHPKTNYNDFECFFKSRNIYAFKNVDFKNLIIHSQATISIMSTTISYALLCEKNVISPRWGVVKNFDLSYPDNVVHYSYNIDDFENTLISKDRTNLDCNYCNNILGNYDGQSISRIVNLIIN